MRTNWGIRFTALFGPGVYKISDKFDVETRKAPLLQTNALKADRSSWIIECAMPATFAVSEQAIAELRLRERLSENRGRIFYGRPAGSISRNGLVAQLFTPPLPVNPTNLEAEVVVRWPAMEFFIERPAIVTHSDQSSGTTRNSTR